LSQATWFTARHIRALRYLSMAVYNTIGEPFYSKTVFPLMANYPYWCPGKPYPPGYGPIQHGVPFQAYHPLQAAPPLNLPKYNYPRPLLPGQDHYSQHHYNLNHPVIHRHPHRTFHMPTRTSPYAGASTPVTYTRQHGAPAWHNQADWDGGHSEYAYSRPSTSVRGAVQSA